MNSRKEIKAMLKRLVGVELAIYCAKNSIKIGCIRGNGTRAYTDIKNNVRIVK